MGDTPEKFRKRAENVDVNLGLFRRHLPRTVMQKKIGFLSARVATR